MNVDELLKEWQADSQINEMDFDTESIRASKLHSKYLTIMSQHNLKLKKIEADHRKRKRILWQYYRGELNNPTDLQAYGLKPMQFHTMKADVQMWLDGDDELNSMQLSIDYHRTMVDGCKEILKQVSNIQWQIRNAIEWRKFIAGD